MAILEIKEYGDPVLREKALPVKEITPEILNLIKDMVETMYTASSILLLAVIDNSFDKKLCNTYNFSLAFDNHRIYQYY